MINYLVQLFEASRLNPDSYGNQASKMRAGNYGEPTKFDNVERLNKINREPDGKRYTIIYEEFTKNSSSDEGYDREVKIKRLNFREAADRHWYSYACESKDINILFNFGGWPKERNHE